MVAVLGGVIGEATISLHLQSFLHEYTMAEWVEPASSWIAFFHGNHNICFISRFNSETSRID